VSVLGDRGGMTTSCWPSPGEVITDKGVPAADLALCQPRPAAGRRQAGCLLGCLVLPAAPPLYCGFKCSCSRPCSTLFESTQREVITDKGVPAASRCALSTLLSTNRLLAGKHTYQISLLYQPSPCRTNGLREGGASSCCRGTSSFPVQPIPRTSKYTYTSL
jgi:hypothetical protein